MENDYLKSYEDQRREYEEALRSVPARQNPSLWQRLGAIATGAFGGWNYDRGGMQWGQQAATEILEGPYKRKYDEYMQQLEAKRRGLDLAQEGVNNRLRLEEMKDRRQQMREAQEEKRKQDAQKMRDIWSTRTREGGKGAAEQVEDEADAQARFGEQLKNGTMRITKGNVPGEDGRPLMFVTPTDKYWKEQEAGQIAEMQPIFDNASQELRLPKMDAAKMTKEGRANTMKYIQELMRAKIADDRNISAERRNTAVLAAALSRQNDRQDYDKDRLTRVESKSLWDNHNRMTQLLNKQYNDRIERARRDGKKAEEIRGLAKEREEAKALLLNDTHQRDALLWKKEVPAPYVVDPNTLASRREGEAPAAPAAPEVPEGTIAENDKGQRIVMKGGKWVPLQ